MTGNELNPEHLADVTARLVELQERYVISQVGESRVRTDRELAAIERDIEAELSLEERRRQEALGLPDWATEGVDELSYNDSPITQAEKQFAFLVRQTVMPLEPFTDIQTVSSTAGNLYLEGIVVPEDDQEAILRLAASAEDGTISIAADGPRQYTALTSATWESVFATAVDRLDSFIGEFPIDESGL